MQKVTTLIVSVEFVSFFAIAAFAHSGATGIVKERMDGMVAIAKSMKELVFPQWTSPDGFRGQPCNLGQLDGI